MFWISYKDLISKYQTFDRTRIFGPEWSITQKWTTIDVAWTADYADTKFSLTLTKNSPIVIVLSQVSSIKKIKFSQLTASSSMTATTKGLRANTTFHYNSDSRKMENRTIFVVATVIMR